MNVYQKPLPVITADSRKYWKGCKDHTLLIQKCKDCGQYRFYPRVICPNCMSMNTQWVKASGKGEIYSFTTVWRAATSEFQGDIPYIIVLVDIEENVRILSWLIDCKPEDVQVGMKVEAIFEDVTEQITLPKFRLAL